MYQSFENHQPFYGAFDQMFSKVSMTVITKQNGKAKTSQIALRVSRRVSMQGPRQPDDALVISYSGENDVVLTYCLRLSVTTL